MMFVLSMHCGLPAKTNQVICSLSTNMADACGELPGAPNEQFLQNICSDVRSPTIFGNFLQGKEHIVLNSGMKNKVALEFS